MASWSQLQQPPQYVMGVGQPTPPQEVTNFEFKALAFADLTSRVIQADSPCPKQEYTKAKEEELPAFRTYRCVCGNNSPHGSWVECSNCHCCLHEACLDSSAFPRARNFKCPFCVLQVDGADPFNELHQWINLVNNDLKQLYSLISQAADLETQCSMHPTNPYVNEYNPRATTLRTQLYKKLQEASTKVQSLLAN